MTPTILEVLGIDRVFNMDGRSVVPLVDGKSDGMRKAVYIEETAPEKKRAIRTDKFKYIRSNSEEDAMCKECECVHGGIEELYDLHRDPEETTNICEENLAEAKRLNDELSRLVKLLESKRRIKPKREIEKADLHYSADEEKLIKERLRELGYF